MYGLLGGVLELRWGSHNYNIRRSGEGKETYLARPRGKRCMWSVEAGLNAFGLVVGPAAELLRVFG